MSTLFEKRCRASKGAVMAEGENLLYEHFMLRTAVMIKCQIMKQQQLIQF